MWYEGYLIRKMGLGVCDEEDGIWFLGSDSRKTLVSERSEPLHTRDGRLEFGACSAPEILVYKKGIISKFRISL